MFRQFQAFDNVRNTKLDAGISSTSKTIVLESGDGDEHPNTANGAATSGGTATRLNSTGIQAKLAALIAPALAAVTDEIFIWNITQGVGAIITAISTDYVDTTELPGGLTWDNSDTWCVGSYVATANFKDSSGVITKSEQILINHRLNDTLTVDENGRGYNGTTAQTWNAGEYLELFVNQPTIRENQKTMNYGLRLIQDVNDDAIFADGRNAFTADQSLGSNKITNLADPVNDQDAVTKLWGVNNLGGTIEGNTLYPMPLLPPEQINISAWSFTDDTRLWCIGFRLTEEISMSKFLIHTETVTTAGTADWAFFSQDGQTKHAEVVGPSLAASDTNYEIALAYTFSPGIYWLACIGNNAAMDVTLTGNYYPNTYDVVFGAGYIPCGYLTLGSSAIPATIDPTALTAVNAGPFFGLLT